MYSIAICDDDAFDRARIKNSIENYFKTIEFKLPSISFYASGEEILSDIRHKRVYDIIFLDVNMNGLDGMETARSIRKVLPEVFIVFITAFINYAPEGYKIGAFRYIIKDNLDKSLYECMTSIRHKFMKNRPLLLDVNEGIKWVKLERIVYLESVLRVIKIHIVSGEDNKIFSTTGKLSDFEEDAAFAGFIRIHKSFLVNPTFIENLRRYEMRLKTGETLVVPKARFKSVLNKYTTYRGVI